MKTYVIGDTHGCYSQFKVLLDSLKADFTQDKLVMLGDYIDRGPQSYEMIQHLNLLRATYGENQIVLLRGNHEQMALDSLEGNYNWGNGCHETLRSLRVNGTSLEACKPFFESLQLYHEDEHFIYVHGGLRPGCPLNEQSPDDLLWIRSHFIDSSKDFGKTVIFGHTPTIGINGSDQPIFMNGKVALDTGCVFGYALCALEIADGHIIKVHTASGRAA